MNNWQTVRLGDVCEKGSSNIAQNEIAENNGDYPIYGAAGFIKNVDFYKQDKPYIGIVKDGAGVGRVSLHPAKSSLIGTMQYIFPKENVDIKFLAEFLKYQNLSRFYTGATIPHIYFKDYQNIPLKLPSLQVQKQISAILNKCTEIIAKNKQMLEKYDKLIKSRFIEMFGDPVLNEKEWEKVRLDSVADIKIGPFGSLLHQEDYISGGHALVNPSHIVAGIIETDEKLTISDKKYEELTPYHLMKNDVVMGRRGEMGRCAVVNQDGLLCGTGSLIIRTTGELEADFIQKIISFPSYKKTIEDKAVGQTMPNLNVPIVSSFEIIKPSKEVQKKYYSFVQQIDKSKFAVQKSLEKAETLYKSLMQEYFG